VSRLDTCLELMTRDGVDALFLGREANARTVSDAARLWLAGTRVFSPGCVVVRSSGAVHVLSNTDAVVPAGFPVERLYGVTWNPEKLLASLAAIEGVQSSRRIAVDGMTPAALALITRAAPNAEIVDAGPIFARMWAIPEAAKTAGVARAKETAEAAMAAMAAMVDAGVLPATLRGIAAEALAARGAPTPAFEAVASPSVDGESTWLPVERPFESGEPVALRVGALHDGFEASLACTFVVGDTAGGPRSPVGWDDLVRACAPGTRVDELRERGAVVWGLGRGVEPWPDELVLVPGLAVALELRDDTALCQDVIRVA